MGYWKFIIMGDNKLNKHYDKKLLPKPFLLMGKIQSEMNLVDKKGMKTGIWCNFYFILLFTFYLPQTMHLACLFIFYFYLEPLQFPRRENK